MEGKMLALVTLAAFVLAASYAFGDYAEGEVIVEFSDAVNLQPPPGVPDGRYPELDALGEEYEVYESIPVFDLPTSPIEHPGGLWDWQDWQDMVTEKRLSYFFVLKYAADKDPGDVAADYAACYLVETAEPDFIGEFYFHPNDPHYSDQWYLYYSQNHECDIHAPDGWDKFIFAPPEKERNGGDPYKPVVAVVDTGIWMAGPSYNQVHSDIKANVIQGRDIFGQDDYPEDIFGHGTAISGIAGAEWHNGLGIAGVGKNDTSIMPVRISDDLVEWPRVMVKLAAGGIIWATQHGADVINMSWSIEPPTQELLNVLKKAVEGAWYLDVNTVVAAGNYGGVNHAYPAMEGRPGMICVAGTKQMPYGWARWEGSSYPPDGADISAPAWPNIYVTWLNNGYKNESQGGTSYSAPMVAATVAGYRHMLASFGDPYPGIDNDARFCVEYSGSERREGEWSEMTGWGTTYYNLGLDHAIEIRPAKDGGEVPTSAAASADITATISFPNPAKDATTLRVELSRCNVTDARFAVYDLSGRKVRELKAPVKGDVAEAAWDLADSSGVRVPPGVYIWRADVGSASSLKKCVVN
jgi:hypothetical protein